MVADLPWTIQLEDAQVWQRERTRVTVEVQSTDRFARLEASLPRIEGVDVQALPATNEAGADGKRILRLSWQLSAHTPGTQTLQLPAIRYNLNGRDAALWQPPLQTLEVQALPPYLPPTTPVGKVMIESHIEPSGVLQPAHLAYWQVSLHSDDVTTAQFPPILKQMGSSEVDLFPAKVTKPANDGGQFRLDYHIPFKPHRSGRLDLPTLQWHWFDPATGRLEQVKYAPPRPWVLGWVWRSVIGVLSLLAVLAGLGFGIKLAGKHWRRWRSKQRILQALQPPDSPQKVRNAMNDCAAAHGWGGNLSLAQWLSCWEQHYGAADHLRIQLQALERSRFASL